VNAHAERLEPETVQRPVGASLCKSCRRPVIWAVTESGKRMPVDYNEHEGGNVFLYPNRKVVIGKQTDETPMYATRHFSHFATCPNAGKHRRTRTTKRRQDPPGVRREEFPF
jgi:hypothetical protein